MVTLLDEAAQAATVEDITAGVKNALVDLMKDGALHIDEQLLVPRPDTYGRRLLHADPAGRYTIVAMIWGQGQGTPIHDHDKKWCVECVYQGEILVTSYDICPTDDPARVSFDCCGAIKATIGSAGALIPPFDYHVIVNEAAETAVTIHVYGGEMEGCNTFQPIEGTSLYERQWKSLSYTD